MDVDDVVAVFRYYAELAGKDSGRLVDTGNPAVVSRIVTEPVGVCVLITPWNYPLLQISWKLAPALAAGNTVVIKPSEVTPMTTIRLVELAEEAGVPRGVVNLLTGNGRTVGAALVEDPLVDLVSFTGGLDTGQSIMRAAAATVKKVAVELGGKNPNIVFADTDLETVVDNALTAVFLHSGQVCSAGARLIVEDSVHDAVVAELAARAERIVLGNGLDPASRERPAGVRGAARRNRGVRRRRAGRGSPAGWRRAPAGRPRAEGGFFYRPTVLADCTAAMPSSGRRPSGPSSPWSGSPTRSEAVALGNDTDFGLAGAVWTGDAAPRRAGRAGAAGRHGLDQRLRPLRPPGRVGRLQALRQRPRARSHWPGRVPGDQAHLAQHSAGSRALVHPLTVPIPLPIRFESAKGPDRSAQKRKRAGGGAVRGLVERARASTR